MLIQSALTWLVCVIDVKVCKDGWMVVLSKVNTKYSLIKFCTLHQHRDTLNSSKQVVCKATW